MSFKKMEVGFAKSLRIGDPKEKYPKDHHDKEKRGQLRGNVKQVTGFVVGLKVNPPKKKKDSPSYLYRMVTQKGDKMDVWGFGALNFALLDFDNPKKPAVKPEYLNHLCRFTYDGVLVSTNAAYSDGRKVNIEVDSAAKLPKGAGRIQF